MNVGIEGVHLSSHVDHMCGIFKFKLIWKHLILSQIVSLFTLPSVNITKNQILNACNSIHKHFLQIYSYFRLLSMCINVCWSSPDSIIFLKNVNVKSIYELYCSYILRLTGSNLVWKSVWEMYHVEVYQICVVVSVTLVKVIQLIWGYGPCLWINVCMHAFINFSWLWLTWKLQILYNKLFFILI